MYSYTNSKPSSSVFTGGNKFPPETFSVYAIVKIFRCMYSILEYLSIKKA